MDDLILILFFSQIIQLYCEIEKAFILIQFCLNCGAGLFPSSNLANHVFCISQTESTLP